jgi:hypothetical protein
LAKKHRELLNASKLFIYHEGGKVKIFKWADNQTREKALDMAYKLRGYYQKLAEVKINQTQYQITDDQLDRVFNRNKIKRV